MLKLVDDKFNTMWSKKKVHGDRCGVIWGTSLESPILVVILGQALMS